MGFKQDQLAERFGVSVATLPDLARSTGDWLVNHSQTDRQPSWVQRVNLKNTRTDRPKPTRLRPK
jgi:hypothetical protein